MKKNVLLIVTAIVISFGIQSCNDDKNSNTVNVQLKLVDAPGDYEEVNIEIIDIQFNSSEAEDGWKSFSPVDGYPINIDLTELIAGNSLLLTNEIIPAGMLKQIRLVLSDNNTIVIEGEAEAIHLDTPSAQQSGLKLKLETELEAGFSYTFILDWDVQKSIVKAGNSDKYNLKPVIRVNTEVNSGSVRGKVIGEIQEDDIDGAVPLKEVIVSIYSSDDTYIAESLTNENGDFIIQGLNGGDYKIKIENDNYVNYESPEIVTVTIGEVLNAGIIELLVPEP
ncbi:MAG: DUF4382 domain-containing protein [Flavobacteriaceae bacterium]|nr:DUF4382 domain-containing protein [Flavobacteriaceae bacterium]